MAFFHHRSLVALRPHERSAPGRTCSPNASMNGPQVLADVVEVDLVEAERRRSSASQADVRREVGGDEHALAHVLGPHVAARPRRTASTVSRSQQSGGSKTFVRHWS